MKTTLDYFSRENGPIAAGGPNAARAGFPGDPRSVNDGLVMRNGPVSGSPDRAVALACLFLGMTAGAVALYGALTQSGLLPPVGADPTNAYTDVSVLDAPVLDASVLNASVLADSGDHAPVMPSDGPVQNEGGLAANLDGVAPVTTALLPRLKPVGRATAIALADSIDRDDWTPSLRPDRRAAAKQDAVPDLTAAAALQAAATTAVLPRLSLARAGDDIDGAAFARSAPQVGLHYAPDQRPPAFFFASDIAPRKPRPRLTIDDDIAPEPRVMTVALSRGETFVDALARAGITRADRNLAAQALGQHQNLRRLRPGHEFKLTLATPRHTIFEIAEKPLAEETNRLVGLEFRPDPENLLRIDRQGPDGFAAAAEAVPLTTKVVAINGRIDGSLFTSATKLGAPAQTVADLANIFAYDVDFQREIFGGDEFEAVFELRYDDRGEMVGPGDILFARLNWRGRQKNKGYYRFSEGGRPEYYDVTGQSAKRLLMKTPIDGARLSSGFGRRHHPVLGYARAHKGVDFAAPRGTPIYAAGDGVIERADRYGSFGNYVRIRHANGYKTAYAHLNGFARGMKSGKRVRQGDVIGYVGTTGRSTGPHLHYEVHLNGTAVNPQRLKIATGVSLKGDALERFKAMRDAIDAKRARKHAPENEPQAVLASDDTGAPSL